MLRRVLNPVDGVVAVEQVCNVQGPHRTLEDGNGAICVAVIIIVVVVVVVVVMAIINITIKLLGMFEQATMPPSGRWRQ